jgi:PIN domain nuclease of toxin-antitoxin system
VNLLLDSHTLLWLMDDNSSLSATAVDLITTPANVLYLSMASVWEIAIKCGLGKLTLSVPYETFLEAAIAGYGLIVLPITLEDCFRYERLEFPDKLHRDPFDRMIVTHALREKLAIVGVDESFNVYGVNRLW